MSKINPRYWMMLAISGALFALPTQAFAQAECVDDVDCPEDTFCLDGVCIDEGDEAEPGPCDGFFECVQEIGCENADCAGPCLEEVEGEAREGIEALIACFEESGCDVEDEECIERSCADEFEEFEQICEADDDDIIEEEEITACDDLFICVEETCGGDPDFECLQECAAAQEEDVAEIAGEAFDCAANSGCDFEDDVCIEEACEEELEELFELCEGDLDEEDDEDDEEDDDDEEEDETDNEGGFNNEPGEPQDGDGGGGSLDDSACSTIGGAGQVNAAFLLLIGLFIVARRRK